MIETKSFFLGEQKKPIERLLKPFQQFLHAQASGGVLLFIASVVALVWANSAWSETYVEIIETEISFGVADFSIAKPLYLWINDGLMAAFFFVVGLEIKREVLVGELSSPREAALPIAGAIGGMVVPAGIYFLFNPGEPNVRGWGVPMATDIAFSLGVLALMGKRIPISAKVFLTAFAIVDDIGASLVIAVFYTEKIAVVYLIWGGVFLATMIVLNVIGVRKPLPYALVGFALWFTFLKSGVHPTIAGVLGAMTIPARMRLDAKKFLNNSKVFLDEFQRRNLEREHVLKSETQYAAISALESACEMAQTPLQRLEHGMQPWVTNFVMPVFALANAGVILGSGLGSALMHPVSLGVIAGLILGKQIGVTLTAWLAVRWNIASLPAGLTWRHIYGLSWLGAIGFTMSLFIAGLAFKSHPDLLSSAKMGVLAASIVAGIGGWIILFGAKKAGNNQTDPSPSEQSS